MPPAGQKTMEANAYTIPLKWGAGVWTVTWLFILGGTAASAWLLVEAVSRHSLPLGAAFVLLVALFGAALYFSEGYSPQCLELSVERISIVCCYRTVDIPRAEILSIEPASALVPLLCIGSSGLFGYTGICLLPGAGRCSIYATACRNLFRIKTASGNIFVNIPEPERI